MGPGALNYVLGITKAYTTGRKRRCGWFDAVMVKQAIITGGITGISLTKLDVLDGFAELKICVGYKLDGKILKRLPAGAANQAAVEPTRLARFDTRGSLLGRLACRSRQICAPRRRAYWLPRQHGQHLARARRRHPDA